MQLPLQGDSPMFAIRIIARLSAKASSPSSLSIPVGSARLTTLRSLLEAGHPRRCVHAHNSILPSLPAGMAGSMVCSHSQQSRSLSTRWVGSLSVVSMLTTLLPPCLPGVWGSELAVGFPGQQVRLWLESCPAQRTPAHPFHLGRRYRSRTL